MEEDPEAARSEWYGQFRSDVSQYLPDALIVAAVMEGRTEPPHAMNHVCVAFVDISGGVSDASVLCIAHKEPGTPAEHLVLDQLLVAKALHSPHEAVARFGWPPALGPDRRASAYAQNIPSPENDRTREPWQISIKRRYGDTPSQTIPTFPR